MSPPSLLTQIITTLLFHGENMTALTASKTDTTTASIRKLTTLATAIRHPSTGAPLSIPVIPR